MARTISPGELRNDISAVLRDVQAGESIEVSSRGEVVAVLVPPARRRESLQVRKARAVGGFAQLDRVSVAQPLQEILDDLRGHR